MDEPFAWQSRVTLRKWPQLPIKIQRTSGDGTCSHTKNNPCLALTRLCQAKGYHIQVAYGEVQYANPPNPTPRWPHGFIRDICEYAHVLARRFVERGRGSANAMGPGCDQSISIGQSALVRKGDAQP